MLLKIKKVYEEKYNILMLLPLLILIASVGVLGINKLETGEFVAKDISLKGGLLVTAQTKDSWDLSSVEKELEKELDATARVKELRSVGAGGRIGYTIELDLPDYSDDVKDAISKVTGFEFVEGQYTVEEMSAALSASFWRSTIRAIMVAFVFMAFVVFLYFRVLVPSLAIIFAAASDLIGTLAVMDVLGLSLSTAGVAALLMLLGYSVDSDILLSTKVLKRQQGKLMERIYSAIKTGLTMEITTLIAFIVILILSPASILRDIAIIMLIGLGLDMLNTWLMNVGLLRLYLDKKNG